MGIRRVLAGAALGAVGSALLALPAVALVPADPYGPVPTPGSLAVSATTVPAGTPLTVTGTGWAATTPVSITSTVVAGFAPVTTGAGTGAGTVPLGAFAPVGARAAGPLRFTAGCTDSCTVTTNSAGSFSVQLSFSRSGRTVITASGLDPSGNLRVQSSTVVVTLAGGGSDNGSGGGSGNGGGSGDGGVGGLPNTGADLRTPLVIGGVLVLLGGGALVAGRRRKRSGVAA